MHETPEYGSRRSAREEAERERMTHIYCTHYITRPRRRHQPSNFQFMSRPVRPSPETQTTRGSITQPRRSRTLSVETRRGWPVAVEWNGRDRKSTRLNSSHVAISYAVFCLKKKKQE